MCDPNVKIVYTKLFINNEWVEAKSGQKFPTINPSTEQVITEVYQGGKEDVDSAVQAAKKAFEPESTWRKMSSYDRGQLLRKLADLFEKHQDELASIESLDNGKAFLTAKDVDILQCIQVFRYYAGWCDKITGKTISIPGPYFCYTRREPVGVCGQIIPWNFPLLMLAWKIAPALCTGCTVVLKPAEQTPLSALRVAALIKEAGYPPGVVNVVTGDGLTGSYIVDHPLVSKIAFTGSTEVGQLIMSRCSINNLKKISLELGGKSPIIVLDDANIDDAVNTAHFGVFFNSGQVCSSSSRIFVHEKIYDEFVKRSIAKAKEIKVGNPFEQQTFNGPQIDDVQFNKVLGYLQKGVEEGAKLECGGKRIGNKGYFVEPTIFSNVTDNMTIAKEEIFGPSMQILKFSDINDAIKRANATQYGLAASVFTNNVEKYLKVVNEFEAGLIAVNGHDIGYAGVPFGGYKKSGFGKDLGEESLDGYLQSKVIVVKQSEDTIGF